MSMKLSCALCGSEHIPCDCNPKGPNWYATISDAVTAAQAEARPAPATGVKYDTDKPMMDLIPPLMEMEVSRVLTAGAQKYSPDNWRHVPELRSRYIAAAKRHINALQQGIACDEETGLHHAAHAVCCLMFMGEIELERGDIPKSGNNLPNTGNA